MSKDGAGSSTPVHDGPALRTRVKGEIRTRMRAIRRAVPGDARALRSSAVCERVLGLAAFERARVVAAFLAIQAEVDLARVVERARELGKTIVMPRVDEVERALVMHVHGVDDALARSTFGVPEPLVSAPRVDASAIDLVLVPALAVDERGHRIGYGQGYYDRFLGTATGATSVCVAFDFQMIPEVSDLPADRTVDVVVTDKRVIMVGRAVAPK